MKLLLTRSNASIRNLFLNSICNSIASHNNNLCFPYKTTARQRSSLIAKSELIEKYITSKDSFKVKYTATDVEPRGVFANNELNLSDIQVYGFDYDYTLAVYKESLDYLIYDLGRNVLIDKYKYPKEINSLEYIPDFAIRGLHYDVENGLLMKIDSFHQIQLGSVYRGLTPVCDDEVLQIYKGGYVPQKLIRSSDEDLKMKQLNDLFSVPEICLLSNVTEYFKNNSINYHPEILFYDVQNAIQGIHPTIHKMLNEDVIEKYLERRNDLSRFLEGLQKNEKKMFLITNSPFKFVDCGMKYMIGEKWTDLFDVVIVEARKPKFFTQKHRPFRKYLKKNDCPVWDKVMTLDKGQIYMEGTVSQLLGMTGWRGDSILYFGDQIYSDLADLTLNYGWRTGAIISELEKEIEIMNSAELKEGVSALQSVQELIDNNQEDKEILKKLLEQREALRSKTKRLFNPQFGSIFRTHHNPTYFSRRLFRYSDIYTSHVTNLFNYSLNHIFSPRRGLLPHECKISQIELLKESS